MFAEKVKRIRYDFIGAWHKLREVVNHMVKGRRGLGRWLAAFIILSLLASLVLPLLSPLGVRAAAPPNTPSNVSPANTASGVTLTPTLLSSTFNDTDGDAHYASQWQIRTAAGNYTSPVYDSLSDINNKISLTIPWGKLNYGTTYYWHVRYQDSSGVWSANYSNETYFTTCVSGVPNKPSNASPADGTIDISLIHIFRASAFFDSDPGDIQYASQWQIRANTGNYSSPVFDSGVSFSFLTQLDLGQLPSRILQVNSTYYWHVRYQCDKGYWSDWSTETSFRTIASLNPSTPINISPVNGATGISLTPTLQSSAFDSLDRGATQAASQWQITTILGNYTSLALIFDSGVDTNDLTQIGIASGTLKVNTTYYWRVRHQDSYGNWSDWSTETLFKAIVSGNPSTPINMSPVNGATDTSLIPTLQSSDFASLDGGATHAASQWQVTTISGNYTPPAIIYDSGVDTTHLTQIGILSGTLKGNTTYYWRVRYQDSYGNWSEWSGETSFTTIAGQPPVSPTNSLPVNGETGVSLTPTLSGSAFSDPDVGDSHAASWWQVTTTPGDYSNSVYDSGVDISNKTSLTILSGILSYNTTYYWHVKYQDSYGNWSGWSTGTSFKTIVSGNPSTPINVAPVNNTPGIILTPTLRTSDFSGQTSGVTHLASQWQLWTGSETLVFDSGIDLSNLTGITILSGYLEYNTTYYWHVRYEDSYYNWSGWSTETSFTTALPRSPQQPTASSPAREATGISLTPTLKSSRFVATDTGDSQAASQWQIRTESGTYNSPVFDSGTDTVNRTQIVIPTGILHYGTTYYWRVRHQDSYGSWSAYSLENLFTTVTPPPQQPTAISPADGAAGISLTPTLESSAFFSPDEEATHTASQWQITTTSGDYSSPVFDSGVGTTALTQITIPSGNLSASTIYYWRVRYQDSYGTWSDYSAEVSFTTVSLVTADFSAVPVQAEPGQTVTFTDTSTGNATSWVWDFGDETTAVWNTTTRPGNGKVTHSYSTAGNYTVSLKASGPAGENTKTKTVLIQVPTPTPPSGGGLPWIYIIIGIVVILAIGGGIFWYLRRRG